MATTTQCVKIASLRKETGDPTMNLQRWLSDPKNVYVGRPGRIFIGSGSGKRVFHYQGSKFANPFRVGRGTPEGEGEFTIDEVIALYEQHLMESGLINEIDELRGKNLGCFCDQRGKCHAKVLMALLQ